MDMQIELQANPIGQLRARAVLDGETSEWLQLPEGTDPDDSQALVERMMQFMGLDAPDFHIGRRDYIKQDRAVADMGKKFDTEKRAMWLSASPRPIKWVWENFIIERLIVAFKGWFWK